jgi:hypothetical protein
MTKTYQRKAFVTANQYQRQIVLLAFFPALIMAALIGVLLTLFYNAAIDVILNGGAAKSVALINQWGGLILSSLLILFILILAWIYQVSRDLVGAFERIIRELDDVIAGKGKRKIQARPKDTLANDLLKRINVLIEDYHPKR